MNSIEDKSVMYEKKSLELIELLENEEYLKIDEKLDERMLLLESIDESEKDKFIEIYNDKKLSEVDEKIKKLFNDRLDRLKQELIKYNCKKQGNIGYSRVSRNKIDIFDKKV
ncbi:hypothetical protein [Metaclostridioides mangenotii]|uniref:hypothetical protein n=1 Tax=Metaclostridioides mangenotii TaxID=1540 RepID=UPI0026ECE4A9|nr:hypothetical protein [Clostridioides mangenotii]